MPRRHPRQPTPWHRTPTTRALAAASFGILVASLAGCFGSTKASFADVVTTDEGTRAVLGQPAPDFLLPDLAGNRVRLSDFAGRRVVLEWFNPECPDVNYAYRKGPLATMAKRWAREDVVWMSINSNCTGEAGSGLEKNRRLAHEYSIEHRVLMDESGIVGRAYGARATPEMFVIAADGRLVYRGALDNAPRGHLQGAAPRNYVAEALDALSSSTPVKTSQTEPYGCRVRYAAKETRVGVLR